MRGTNFSEVSTKTEIIHLWHFSTFDPYDEELPKKQNNRIVSGVSSINRKEVGKCNRPEIPGSIGLTVGSKLEIIPGNAPATTDMTYFLDHR